MYKNGNYYETASHAVFTIAWTPVNRQQDCDVPRPSCWQVEVIDETIFQVLDTIRTVRPSHFVFINRSELKNALTYHPLKLG